MPAPNLRQSAELLECALTELGLGIPRINMPNVWQDGNSTFERILELSCRWKVEGAASQEWERIVLCSKTIWNDRLAIVTL